MENLSWLMIVPGRVGCVGEMVEEAKVLIQRRTAVVTSLASEAH